MRHKTLPVLTVSAHGEQENTSSRTRWAQEAARAFLSKRKGGTSKGHSPYLDAKSSDHCWSNYRNQVTHSSLRGTVDGGISATLVQKKTRDIRGWFTLTGAGPVSIRLWGRSSTIFQLILGNEDAHSLTKKRERTISSRTGKDRRNGGWGSFQTAAKGRMP